MPRTDEEIFAYMDYYSTTPERKWALENLCRVEHKTKEEIFAICEKFTTGKEDGTVGKEKYDPEIKQKIIDGRLAGRKAVDIAAEVGLTQKQVENIYTVYRMRSAAKEKTPAKETKRLWFAMYEELRAFAEGVLGAGSTMTAMSADEDGERATVTIRTADGKTVHFSAEACGNG